MWDPTSHTHNNMPSVSNTPAPQTGCAIIDDEDKALPCPNHKPLVHTSQPALIQDNDGAPPIVSHPQMPAQLCTQAEAHLINKIIQDNLMSNSSLAITPHKLHHGYSQDTQAILVQTYVRGTDSTCFIGAIINDDMGDTFEYCQLIKIPIYQDIGTRSFANKLN